MRSRESELALATRSAAAAAAGGGCNAAAAAAAGMSMALAPRLSSTGELSRAIIPATLGHLRTPSPTRIPTPHSHPLSGSRSRIHIHIHIHVESGELVLSQWATPPPPVLSDDGAGRVLTPPLYAVHDAMHGAVHDAMHGAMHGAVPCNARCGARPSHQRRSSPPQLPGVEHVQARGCDTHSGRAPVCRADPL